MHSKRIIQPTKDTMDKKPYYISVCSQKGGVGKSTFTVLLASLLHYRLGRRVLVADCDFPQWSIEEQRRRELEILDRVDGYKLMMIRQFKASGRKIWPLLAAGPTTALRNVEEFLVKSAEPYDYVLFDLPGTTAIPGVLPLIAQLDRVFIPLKADKIVMESSITFARTLTESFIPNKYARIRGVHLFWSMIDARERTSLYAEYEQALLRFRLPLLHSRIPQRARFGRELLPGGGPVSRSTLFAPERAFAAESSLEALAREVCTITEEQA